jgi:hypothetical protein
MSGNPEYQNLDPISPPDRITPAADPSSPAGYAMVTPHGRGPAAYDIQAPLSDGEITAAFNDANDTGGNGVLYPMSPRIADTRTMMMSPQGFGSDGYDIFGGYHEGGGAGWPADVEPVHDGP